MIKEKFYKKFYIVYNFFTDSGKHSSPFFDSIKPIAEDAYEYNKQRIMKKIDVEFNILIKGMPSDIKAKIIQKFKDEDVLDIK